MLFFSDSSRILFKNEKVKITNALVNKCFVEKFYNISYNNVLDNFSQFKRCSIARATT